MPAVNETHTKVLGPLIQPFQRSPDKALETHLRKGEGHNDEFLKSIHDGIDNNRPEPYHELTIEELKKYRINEGGKYLEKCYLWVIDEVSIKIIWEKTSNILRGEEIPTKPFVCHTNITGCQPAYIGGELHFCADGNIYVNFSSDRYGRPETLEKRKMAIRYIEEVGYKNIVMTNDFLK